MITAPPYARTLLSKNGTWKESKLYYKCICGHWGHVSELLCVKEERVLWCPKCLKATTKWMDGKDEQP